MYNKSVLQYCRYLKNDDHHERSTVNFPFNIKDYAQNRIIVRWWVARLFQIHGIHGQEPKNIDWLIDL